MRVHGTGIMVNKNAITYLEAWSHVQEEAWNKEIVLIMEPINN